MKNIEHNKKRIGRIEILSASLHLDEAITEEERNIILRIIYRAKHKLFNL